MAKLTLYPSGFKASKPPRKITTRGARSDVIGWSKNSARRCDLFLRSVDIDALLALNLYGIAATLTVGNCPATHADWTKLIRRFLERMTRRSLVLAHYVTEWQPRSRLGGGPVPHLHAILFFETQEAVNFGGDEIWADIGPGAVEVHWVDIARRYNTSYNAQHCEVVTDLQGWFRYLAKHAARSVDHYQRNPDLIPKGWEKTGRMWGRRGQWPVREINLRLSEKAFYALRRFANRYQRAKVRTLISLNMQRLADARGTKQREECERLLRMSQSRLVYLSKQLQRHTERIGRILPVSEWVPENDVNRWLKETCVHIEATERDTGEVTPYYHLGHERSQLEH